VRDPELDEPITDLGFVHSAVLAGGHAEVELRLPTYFCAPNFAYLMVADAHDAVGAVPGVEEVTVRLLDHFTADEINAGVAEDAGFTGSFPGLAEAGSDTLSELRRTFRRKAHAAAQEVIASGLLAGGRTHEELTRTRLGDLPDSPAVERLRRRRDELGLPAGPDAPLLVDDEGRALEPAGLPLRLRFARTTRVSIEGNAGFCRGLLVTRYGTQVGS
jgi:metal-sulfur cluster biosynthetic enzyme